ncbi:hypothetical protein C8034_v008562 [Colletotrichum sidae]|uniref:Uncharacterized protein n=1 Tax=Colletotrichum sidae TaxID=1347389 RepID=A0A4R8TPQ7_9PEZI|nr:hypothetical protein C8034_v008562 [Colletotrichum sidae]
MTSAMYRQTVRAAQRIPLPRTLPTSRILYRTVATKQSSSGVSSNVREPISSDPSSQTVNKGRGIGPKGSPDTASIQNPVSNPGDDGIGLQEEPQPSQENIINDPKAPAAEKRANVEKEGKKPLDPADK